MNTTLTKLRKRGPCADGWKKLLDYLGKTVTDDEPLSIADIAKSNGLNDALWALRSVDSHDREIRLFAVWCARQVQHLMIDPRSLAALDVAEKFGNNQATVAELAAAWDDARAASWDATQDARAAARAAAGAAAGAARDAAWDAAWDAARAASWDAELAAAWDAAQAASWDATRDARAAAGAAWDAARAASWDAALDAALDAARAAQLKRLLEICEENK